MRRSGAHAVALHQRLKRDLQLQQRAVSKQDNRLVLTSAGGKLANFFAAHVYTPATLAGCQAPPAAAGTLAAAAGRHPAPAPARRAAAAGTPAAATASAASAAAPSPGPPSWQKCAINASPSAEPLSQVPVQYCPEWHLIARVSSCPSHQVRICSSGARAADGVRAVSEFSTCAAGGSGRLFPGGVPPCAPSVKRGCAAASCPFSGETAAAAAAADAKGLRAVLLPGGCTRSCFAAGRERGEASCSAAPPEKAPGLFGEVAGWPGRRKGCGAGASAVESAAGSAGGLAGCRCCRCAMAPGSAGSAPRCSGCCSAECCGGCSGAPAPLLSCSCSSCRCRVSPSADASCGPPCSS